MIPFDISEAKDNGFYVSGTTQSGKTNLAKHLVQRLTDEGITVYVLDISKAWPGQCSIDEVVEVPANSVTVTVPTNNSTVIDLSALEYIKRIKYVIAFCKAIYNYNVSFGFKRASQKFIIFEEGHTYFQNGCFRNPREFSPCVDLITVGANYNLRFGVVTQFPSSIDKALVKVTQQRYFGWSTEMNDLKYIRSFLGQDYVSPTLKNGQANPNSVFNLKKGEFVYQLRSQIEKIQSSRYTAPQSSYNFNGGTMEMQPYNQSVNYSFSLQGQTMNIKGEGKV
jgi:molybdopterin-guanine dinucleotide biosynthesis protein